MNTEEWVEGAGRKRREKEDVANTLSSQLQGRSFINSILNEARLCTTLLISFPLFPKAFQILELSAFLRRCYVDEFTAVQVPATCEVKFSISSVKHFLATLRQASRFVGTRTLHWVEA